MDKAEYRIKLEEINRLAEQGNFAGAAAVADEVDWKHVKSARTLCMIGEIYEADKRYEDSVRVLKLAYRRSSSSKTVLYRLAELDIRTGDFEEARKFINEFEQNSPGDMSRYILKYKLLRAQRAPLDEQIAVLRDYRDNEYTERWSYELAKLYKKNGQKERCIEECDDMILWFAEGKYVRKAMELKMSLTELTPTQQQKYDAMLEMQEAAPSSDAADEDGQTSGNPEDAAAASAEAGTEEETGQAVRLLSEETESQYGALETVEKSVMAADEEDDEEGGEAHSEISADEAIQRMDSAAGRFSPEDLEAVKTPASPSIQERLTKGFRSLFAGLKLDAGEEEEAEVRIEEEPGREPRVGAPESEEDLAEAFSYAHEAVRERETAADGSGAETGEESGEGPADEDADMKIAGGELDLDALLKETDSALAGEVASGEYVMADTLEEHLEEAEEQARAARERNEAAAEENLPGAEEAAAEEDILSEEEKRAQELIGRETDESLGLTREFHFKEELAKAAGEEAADEPSPEADRAPIEAPEEASRKLVRQHYGEEVTEEAPEDLYEACEEEAETAGETGAEETAEEPDRGLLAAFEADEDFADLPEEESGEDAEEAPASEIMTEEEQAAEEEGPEIFEIIPVEGRRLSDEEKKALSYFANIPGIDMQLTAALADIHNNAGDKTSRSGNVLIMGRQGSGKTRLADGLIMMTCMHLGIGAAKVGRIVANRLNGRDAADVVRKLAGGFLVIEAAGELSDETVDRLNQAMDFRTDDLVVILEDEKADLKAVLDRHPAFAEKFTSQITVPVFTNDELVTFAKTYAGEEGYKFDDMATLALYTMIGDNQKDAEPMTIARVREMIDKAISKSSHRIFGKVKDKEDGRVILQEKDFAF